jgi:hypothetical protein
MRPAVGEDSSTAANTSSSGLASSGTVIRVTSPMVYRFDKSQVYGLEMAKAQDEVVSRFCFGMEHPASPRPRAEMDRAE